MKLIPLLLCSLDIISSKVDIRQTATNKAFIANIPDGDYEVVHPFQIRDKNERIGIDTRNYFLKAAEHYQHVTIVIRSNAVGRLKLVLERNNYIFLNQTSFRKLDANGEHTLSNRVENCYYQGTIAGDSTSFVALSSCNGLRGVMAFSNGSTYGIWPLDGGDRGRRHPHVFYKTQWTQDAKCGVTMTGVGQDSQLRMIRQHKHRRDLSKQTKYVEVAVIGDYEFMKEHGSLEDESITYMLETINIADSMLSRDLNIRLSVVYSELWLDVQRVDLFEDIERTLTGVIDYAAGHIYHIVKDASILFTGGSFANKEVINSAFRSVCTARAATIIKALDTFSSQWSGQILSQSIGHMLGLEHDTQSCQCDMGNNCIMSGHPGTIGAPFAWQFSKCSVARMHGVWHSGHVHCLLNRPFEASQLRECGNGIVDGSEECDCGSREECSDPCCDPLTCTLRAHAQCAAHHKCCHRCELRKAGELCRSSRSVCDVAEVCDGKLGDCPADGYLVDGTACGEDGQCWRGNCSDPQAQCKAIWGRDSKVADSACFEQNERGHEYANCGVNTDGERSCLQEDVRCGTLHCQGGSSTPSQSTLRAFTFQFQHNEQQIQCKSIADSHVGLAADGSTCGSGRVCVAGSCVEMSSVSAPIPCPSNNHALQCSGHGDCTTTSVCVCFSGWTGKACDTRTNSTFFKSINLNAKQIVVIPSIAMGKSLDTVTLLGILLLVGVGLLLLLVCLLFCYRRRSVVEIPTPSDEKLDDSLPDQTQRSIKFGSMPSWRDEKRKRKSNKHVYGALNRITEADERDSASLRSRESGSQNTGSQLLFEPRAIPSSRSDVGVSCTDRSHDNIYAESSIGIGYRSGSPVRRTDVYTPNTETYGLRSFGSWRDPPTSINPNGNVLLAPTPLRLNNINQILRNLQYDDELQSYSDPLPLQYPSESFVNSYNRPQTEGGDEELSAVEADHELGSNTESSRGYEQDVRINSAPGEKWAENDDLTSPAPPNNSFDFRQSPSLFNDSFKLEMSSSIHT